MHFVKNNSAFFTSIRLLNYFLPIPKHGLPSSGIAAFSTSQKDELPIYLWPLVKDWNQEWEQSYREFKTDRPISEELLRFGLKNIVYGGALALGTLAYQQYIQTNRQLEEIASVLEKHRQENAADFETIRAVQIQPNLYLTTILTKQDELEYQQNSLRFRQGLKQLNDVQTSLEKFNRYCLSSPLLSEKKTTLTQRLTEEKDQLETVQLLNDIIWMHKNRQYQQALKKIQGVIEKLENYRKNSHATVFPLSRTLAAAYNTQAKLHACLGRVIDEDKQVTHHRTCSLRSYDAAIDVIEKDSDSPTYTTDLAILKSSKAYLLGDQRQYEEALQLHHEALALKPTDAHIICGVGTDLYEIEHHKPVDKRDPLRLDEADTYLTRAIQINGSVPNIYVTRGKLRAMRGDRRNALADFDQALQLDKNHSAAHIEKALLLGRCHPEAQKHLSAGASALLNKPAESRLYRERIKAVWGKNLTFPGSSVFFKSMSAHSVKGAENTVVVDTPPTVYKTTSP